MFPKIGVGWAPQIIIFFWGGFSFFFLHPFWGVSLIIRNTFFFSEMNGYWSCEKENTWTTYILKPINWWSGSMFWAFSVWGLFQVPCWFSGGMFEHVNMQMDWFHRQDDFAHSTSHPKTDDLHFFFRASFVFENSNDPRGVWWCFLV